MLRRPSRERREHRVRLPAPKPAGDGAREPAERGDERPEIVAPILAHGLSDRDVHLLVAEGGQGVLHAPGLPADGGGVAERELAERDADGAPHLAAERRIRELAPEPVEERVVLEGIDAQAGNDEMHVDVDHPDLQLVGAQACDDRW